MLRLLNLAVPRRTGTRRHRENGAPGVENRLTLLYQGVLAGHYDLNRFVELSSTAAARTFGMYPKKGTVAVGSDADIVVFDPDKRTTLSVNNADTHHMKVDYCSYEGFEVTGYPETVLSRGRVIVKSRKLETKGGGRFIKRAHTGDLLR